MLLAISRIETFVRLVAISVGILVAVSIPSGYFALSYVGEARDRAYEARLSAGALSKYAYTQGEVWRFNKPRLAELISFVAPQATPIRQIVRDDKDNIVLTTGAIDAWPAVTGEATIVAGPSIVGRVEVALSLRPVLLETSAAGLIGILLGLTSFLAVDHLPVRALRRTLQELRMTQEQLKHQVAETSAAYEQLQQQHRISTETAEQLAGALRRVEDASRTKSAFLTNMSHELRTPLNAIIGFADILKDEELGPADENHRGYAADISESGNHLLTIINDILDMSKIEAGRLELHEESVDLGEIVEACHRLLRERAAAAGVALVVEPPGSPLPHLSADPTKLKQIVLNLLSNSLKFTPRGGTVTVATSLPAKGSVVLEVGDTGIGMSPENVVLALEPFRQVDNSHTREYAGTGLGLPLAKALTELHGGELRIASELGRGTVVRILLPVRRPLTVAA